MYKFGLNTNQVITMDSKEGLEALFEYATEGILVANSTGEIVKTNPATERMFGYTKGELLGKKVEILIPMRYAKHHVGHRDKYVVDPHPRSMGAGRDLHGIKKDGTEFPVEISLSPYITADGKFVIAFVVDITVRKKAEHSIRLQSEEVNRLANELRISNIDLEKKVRERTMILEEAVEELNKTKEELNDAVRKEKELNELKSRFVSMVSHEFRTPLTTILSSLSLATKYGEQNEKEKQVKHFDRIKNSVSSLTDILNDVLSISKLEEGKISISIESLILPELVTEIIEEMKMIADRKIMYQHTGEEKVFLDKKIIKHVLFNLISNALKFSPKEKPIEVSSSVTDSAIEFSIKDSGIGISEDDQSHLFGRFFRGQNAINIQGTGLGLHIVAKYIEMLNGSIECKSQLEKGTTFIIKLPKIKKDGKKNPTN